jgi:tRNA nucleotidyltransferase/poly(A) polymerase
MHETARHSIARLAQAFHAQGKALYLVGGTVRDELLGRPSHVEKQEQIV